MLDARNDQLLHGIEARRAEPDSIADRGRNDGLGERLHQRQNLGMNSRLPRVPIRLSSIRRRSVKAGDSGQPCKAAA